jgi:hypothetical protein
LKLGLKGSKSAIRRKAVSLRDLGHRVLKMALKGTIFGSRREAKPFGEAPEGALKLVPSGAKSGLRSGVVAPSRLVTPSGGAGSRKSSAIWLQILFFVPSGTSSLPRSDVGLLLVGPVPIEGAAL